MEPLHVHTCMGVLPQMVQLVCPDGGRADAAGRPACPDAAAPLTALLAVPPPALLPWLPLLAVSPTS